LFFFIRLNFPDLLLVRMKILLSLKINQTGVDTGSPFFLYVRRLIYFPVSSE
jgi:hypothetical protein